MQYRLHVLKWRDFTLEHCKKCTICLLYTNETFIRKTLVKKYLEATLGL